MKQLIINQIEVTQNGTVQVRMHKFSSDGDLLGNHRASLPPASDVNAQVTAVISAVNTHMATENYGAISASDVAKLTAICNTAWTAEVIAAYQAAQAEAEAAQTSGTPT
jgi:hypothetical protein